MFCERNKEIALKKLCVHTTIQDGSVVVDVTHNEENTEAKKDEEKEDEENKQKTKVVKNGHVGNLEIAERQITTASNTAIWLLGRSSSLTCAETVDDISVSASFPFPLFSFYVSLYVKYFLGKVFNYIQFCHQFSGLPIIMTNEFVGSK